MSCGAQQDQMLWCVCFVRTSEDCTESCLGAGATMLPTTLLTLLRAQASWFTHATLSCGMIANHQQLMGICLSSVCVPLRKGRDLRYQATVRLRYIQAAHHSSEF